MGTANTGQGRYWHREDDGTESGATFRGAINSGWTPVLADLDIPLRIRIEVSNTGAKDENSDPLELWLDVDGGGYNKITQSSTDGVKLIASATVIDGQTTTEQMSGSQTFQDGEFDSNGTVANIVVVEAQDTEMEYCYKLDSANLSGGEVLSFRVYLGGSSLDFYTNTPSITAPTPLSGEWTQAEFRIRASGDDGNSQLLNADGAGDWAEDANTNATLQASARRHGTVFGLRFKVSAAVAAGSKSVKIRKSKNGGAYADMVAIDHSYQEPIVAMPDVGVFPTDRFTDGTATTQLLSGSSYVAGTGEHDATAAAVNLGIGEHTEIEWRIFINKTWEDGGSGNFHGDYYEFQLVESDGTPLTTYTNTPRITLDYDTDYVGGCYPESIGSFGIFYASDGDAFTFVEESEITGAVMAVRRATGTVRWIEIDGVNAPAGLQDLESFHVQQIGNILHLFYVGGQVRYETFDMSTHNWGQLDEEVEASSIGANQCGMGARRSGDGTTIMAWIDASDDLVYKERTSGGVWDSTATVIYAGTVSGACCVLAENDKIYFSWNDAETTIYSQSLNSSNSLGVQRTISTDPGGSGSGVQWALTSPVYWDDAGTEKVGIFYQRATDDKLYWRIISDDGVPATESVVTDSAVANNAPWVNSRQPSANAIVDGTTIYLGYSRDDPDYDLYYTVSDNGAAFDTDTEAFDGLSVHAVGLGFTSGTLSFITEEAHADSAYSGFTGGIQVREVAIEEGDHDLIATDITTTPVLGTPAIGQVHILAANDVTTTPVLGSPEISQIVDLVATDVITTPVVEASEVGQIHILAANDVTTTPVVEDSEVGQIHILAANDVITTPVLGSPEISQIVDLVATDVITTPVVEASEVGQIHILAVNDVTTTPVVEDSEVGQIHILAANDVTTTPVVEDSEVGQIHILAANDVTTTPVLGAPTISSDGTHSLAANDVITTPVLGVPTIGQTQVLAADDITTTPVLESPTIGQAHILAADDVITTPVVDASEIGQAHTLSADDITTTPVVEDSEIGQTQVLAADDITTTPVVEDSEVGQAHILTANDVITTPVVDTTAIGQTQVLAANDVTTTPILGAPTISTEGTHALVANDVTTTPVLGAPIIGQEQVLAANDVTTTPVLGTPAISQIVDLVATGISTTPVVDSVSIGQAHVLAANDVTTTPVVDDSEVGQAHALAANDVTTTPVVDDSEIGHIHVLDADDISTTPVLGAPLLGQTNSLLADDITTTPVLGTPALGTEGEHHLLATGITTTPVLDTPAIGQTHVLSATGISTTPTLDKPAILVIYHLDATDIATTPVVDSVALGQIHALAANEILTTPIVDATILGNVHVLSADGILAIPELGLPDIGQIHVLSAVDTLASPILGTPAIGQTHVMIALGISTTPILGVPSMDLRLVGYPADIVFNAIYPTADANAVYPDIEVSVITEV